MREVKINTGKWWDPCSRVLPTTNLTSDDLAKIKARDAYIDELKAEGLRNEHWIKLNKGLFKGSIFRVSNENQWAITLTVDETHGVNLRGKHERITNYLHGLDDHPTKKYDFAHRSVVHYQYSGQVPIKLNGGTLYPEFFGSDISRTSTVLLDYDGPEVFCMDEKKRPLTFKDRLDQDVTLGDLVVVALTQGGGLDICTVKGFADERRVVIESVDTGRNDRIPLENNETPKIMRMPNSLKDTALLMKLGRK